MLVQVALANFIFTVMKKLILRHFENIFNSVVKKVGSAHMHLLLLFSILFNALKVVFIYTQTFLFLPNYRKVYNATSSNELISK